MTDKRYYQREFEEYYYVIDSEVISEKDFDEKYLYDGFSAFEDSLTVEEIVDLLNENEQLKSDKEYWKLTCTSTDNENQILWNEIHQLIEKGAEPSNAFKEYLESISTEYDKFWNRKLEKAKEDRLI